MTLSTATLEAAAPVNPEAGEWRTADESRGDFLADLAGADWDAYLAALTDVELGSRAKWSRLCGELWDADQFDAEISRRAA